MAFVTYTLSPGRYRVCHKFQIGPSFELHSSLSNFMASALTAVIILRLVITFAEL
jgi:hypothetical protein